MEYLETPRTFADVEMSGSSASLETGGRPQDVETVLEEEKEGGRRGILPELKIPDWKRIIKNRSPAGQILVEGSLTPVDSLSEMLASDRAEAFLVPKSWGVESVAELRRELGGRAPIVVIGGGREFLHAGADRCVRRLTFEVVGETSALARRYRELWSRAETDPLTGCYTRGFWDSWFKDHRDRAVVALLDLDRFKSVNDTHGHAAGDAVLRAFGEFLRSSVRGGDVVARYGGDEFVIGLLYVNSDGALALINRLRDEWSARKTLLPSGESIACTFSAGVSGELVDADKALYEAKSAGRNRAKVSKESFPVSIHTAPIQAKAITILSPWIPDCPVTSLAVEAAQHLAAKDLTVGLIDAAVKSPGISRLLGIPDTEVWEYDWRLGGVEAGAQSGRLLVWPLDPLRPGPVDEDSFVHLVEAASNLVDHLIIDGGSDPALVAGHALVLVASRPDLPEIVRAWNFFRPVTDGSLVLLGNCDATGFGLPVAGAINRPGDWRRLLNQKLERRDT
ncbi:MAG: diguanylate cyclase [Candidatus Desulforudis sp.]|nr:diguanylate cyclase [Desulforudis sp.]